jgi:hypothetical protein
MVLKGIVTAVQESRFQLALDTGGIRLLVLAHQAPLECAELLRLKRDRVPVVVRCRANAALVAAEAHHISTTRDRTEAQSSSGATP